MVRIKRKAFWLFVPASVDVFVGGQASERFASLGKVVSHLEGVEMVIQVLMRLIVVFPHRRGLEGAVHALHLAVRPGMIHLGHSVLDSMFMADAVKDMDEGQSVALAVCQLDTGIVNTVWILSGTAAIRLRRKWAATILLASACNSA